MLPGAVAGCYRGGSPQPAGIPCPCDRIELGNMLVLQELVHSWVSIHRSGPKAQKLLMYSKGAAFVNRAGGCRGAGGAAVGVPRQESFPHRVPGASLGTIGHPKPRSPTHACRCTFTFVLGGVCATKGRELSGPASSQTNQACQRARLLRRGCFGPGWRVCVRQLHEGLASAARQPVCNARAKADEC